MNITTHLFKSSRVPEIMSESYCFYCNVNISTGLVHVGDELREVNGNLITHKGPDEISQILVHISAVYSQMLHHQLHSADYMHRSGIYTCCCCFKKEWFVYFYNPCLQSQSQGSITLKIIPAIKEEDKHKESTVNGISHYDPQGFLQFSGYSHLI